MKDQYMLTDGDTVIKGGLETVTHCWNLMTGFTIPSNEQEQEIANLTNFDLVSVQS